VFLFGFFRLHFSSIHEAHNRFACELKITKKIIGMFLITSLPSLSKINLHYEIPQILSHLEFFGKIK
jgi:hypothetical protein